MKSFFISILSAIVGIFGMSIVDEVNVNTRLDTLESQIIEQRETINELSNSLNTNNPLKYFRFALVDGTYSLIAINYYEDMPNVLQIPSSFKGIAVTKISNEIFYGIPIKALIIPSTITLIGINICTNSPVLEAIVCLGSTPCELGSFALDTRQLNGFCKIYVPDDSVNMYKATGTWNYAYKNMIYPMSTLDVSISSQINYI